MNILALHCTFAHALEALGHRVLALSPQDDALHAPTLLDALREQERFIPDLFLQQESLGKRLVLRGLEAVPCPTFFLAVDSHLNMFWHRHYARLFDGLLTPHMSLFQALPREWRHPATRHFAHTGADRPWKDFAARGVRLGLCARLTSHRPVRGWLVDLLRREFGLLRTEGLGFEEMLDFYQNTRLAPNEAIGREVNFRLLEAASCGCMVFSQDIGADQDSLFSPGREIMVYRDGLELREQIRWATTHPGEAEAMGRAAWERVRAGHLPVHRAGQLLDLARQSSRARATGEDARRLAWLTDMELARNRMLLVPIAGLLDTARGLAPTPEVMAARLRLFAESGRYDDAMLLARHVLAEKLAPDSLDMNAAASAFALKIDDLPLARGFFLRHTGKNGQNALAAAEASAGGNPRAGLCLAWSDAFRKAGQAARPGARYTQDKGLLPGCAFEFLILAQHFGGESPGYLQRATALTSSIPAYASLHNGYLAVRSNGDPADWRTQLAYGLSCLRVCRVEEGLFEVRQARDKAMAGGGGVPFGRMLAASPARAYIDRELVKGTYPHA